MGKIQSFDDLLTNRIKFGKAQIQIYIIIAQFWLLEGGEASVIGFILPILEKECLLAGSMFLGWLIGCLLTGYFADTYGRKFCIFYATLGTLITAILSSLSANYYQLILLRTFFGIFTGFLTPLSSVYLIEFTPAQNRGRYQCIVQSTFAIGQIFIIFLSSIFLDSFESGNWRALLFWAALPGIIAFYYSWKWLEESPRYLFLQNRNEQAFRIVNDLIIKNGGQNILTENERNNLMKYFDQQKNRQEESQGYKSLFQPQYIYTTLKLLFMWFSISFIFYATILCLPIIINKLQKEEVQESKENGLLGMVGIELFEFASFFVSAYLIENKKYGRKNNILYGFLLSGIFSIITFIYPYKFFFILVSGVKFFINICFVVIYSMTSEIFDTSQRASASGLCNGICRISAMVLPKVTFIFFIFGPTGVFLCNFKKSLFAAYAANKIEMDTTNMDLDSYMELLNKTEDQFILIYLFHNYQFLIQNQIQNQQIIMLI